MRALLHVLATLVLVPYLVLAAGFLILGHMILSGSPWAMLDTLLAHALWIVPWGAIGFGVGIVALAIAGAVPRTRRPAAALLAVLAGGALAVLVLGDSSPLDVGAFVFLLPCIAALACGVWLAREPMT